MMGIIYLSELPALPHGLSFQSGQTMLSGILAFTVPAGAAEMMDTTVRTVSMVCTLMIVLSRCFYAHGILNA